MAPTLVDGDFVVVIRLLGRRSRPKSGDVVLLEPDARSHGASPWKTLTVQSMVKRIVGGDSVRGYEVAGDNMLSASSSHLGLIPITDVVGRVRFRIPKTGRIQILTRRSDN